MSLDRSLKTSGKLGQKRSVLTRTERIEKPKSIEVNAKVQAIDVTGNQAKVVLRQSYRSDTLRNTTTKTLGMVRSGDRWLIIQEKVGG